MDMSKAALPAISGFASKADETHPLYREWRNYESFCTRQMINGMDFRAWIGQRERFAKLDEWANHPEYKSFLAWMRETKGGARTCPAGNAFPNNFQFWLEGGRW